MAFRIGSLFDGSGGFPLAASLCGGTPIWASEIEPYPIAVTKSRFPSMKHLGSVTDVKGNKVEPVDVITFGSPCQDLSVAGKRAGLKHEDNGDEETTRSGLFMEAVRIIKEMREATNGVYPRFAVWENVPGAFSSNKGEDFRTVCEELIKIVEPGATMPAVPKNGWPYADSYCGEGWSLSYRTYDAQFWGVPQRRRRIYLVADFRGECAGKVSFEREGLRGYFAESGTPWKGTAADAERGAGADNRDGAVPYTLKIRSGCEGGGKGALIQTDKSATLSTLNDQYLFQPVVDRHILDDQGGQQITVRTDGKSPTLRAETHGNLPCVLESAGFKELNSAKARSDAYEHEVAPCLSANKHDASVCVKEALPFDTTQVTSPMNYRNPKWGAACHTLAAGANAPAVVCKFYDASGNGDGKTVNTQSDDYNNQVTEYSSVVVEGEPVYCLQGNGIDRTDTAGCNGKGVKEDICSTLNTIDRPAAAFQTYQKVTSPLMENSHPGSHTGRDDFSDMLVAEKENIIVFDKEAYQSGQNATGGSYISENGPAPTLRTTGHPPGVCVRYIVRRITPTECARLQGFADAWAVLDSKKNLTDEEYAFWCKVNLDYDRVFEKARPNEDGWYNVWREVKPRKTKGEDFEPYWEDTGKPYTHKTKEQMLKWYNKLHTDGSEYKLWGNGIALPNAMYVMQGIAEVLNQ